MEQYHAQQELAPRDIVARAIDAEMKRTGARCVYLDITHQPADFIRDRFPNIYETCLRYGIDITREPIPVVPAAHYQCGGVLTDVNGATEPARASTPSAKWPAPACTAPIGWPAIPCSKPCVARPSLLRRRSSPRHGRPEAWLHRTARRGKAATPWMWTNSSSSITTGMKSAASCGITSGIVRTTKRLQRAATRLRNLEREIQEFYWNFKVTTDLLELRNLCTVAALIVDSALLRKESRGLHTMLDFPQPASG